jgi:aromatic ring hydroxylase
VFFYRHTRAAAYIRSCLHRYSAYNFVLRLLYVADMMIGAALWECATDRSRKAAGCARETCRARGLA